MTNEKSMTKIAPDDLINEDLQADEVTTKTKGYMKYPQSTATANPQRKFYQHQHTASQGSLDSEKSEESHGRFADRPSYDSMISEGTSNASSLLSDSITNSISRKNILRVKIIDRMPRSNDTSNICNCWKSKLLDIDNFDIDIRVRNAARERPIRIHAHHISRKMIIRYRDDFDDLKCKMRIFGESLNLCKCIASDFKGKVKFMETRLQALEKRQNVNKTESNYSAIIQKNKELSNKTKGLVKKLQMCRNEDEMREIIGKICRNYLHGAWKTIKPSELQFSKISGGLSNFLYYVALPEDPNKIGELRDSPDDQTRVIRYTDISDEPRKVLLRIYGQVHGERAMDAIVTESVIFTLLSERKLGPKLYGVFSGGRIEEYIPARALKTKELAEPALSMKIAEKMAAIHSMDIPLSKEPNWIWKTMAKWVKSIKSDQLAPHSKGKNKQEQEFIQRLRSVDFDKEMEWLKKFLSTIESPVVFCHNDMQEGNILLMEELPDIAQNDDYVTKCVQTSPKSSNEVVDRDPSLKSVSIDNMSMEDIDASLSEAKHMVQTQASKAAFLNRSTFIDQHFDDANTSDTIISQLSDSDEPKLVLIDFEYCSYNYRGFDVANHFQEWTYDYTNPEYPFYYELLENAPTLEQKEIFIREYLKHFNANLYEDKESAMSIDAVNQLLDEVEAFAVASHLFWGLWSIINASKSQIPFGYWEYAISRIDTYFMLKQEIIKKDKFGYPQKRKICEVDI